MLSCSNTQVELVGPFLFHAFADIIIILTSHHTYTFTCSYPSNNTLGKLGEKIIERVRDGSQLQTVFFLFAFNFYTKPILVYLV